MRLSKQSRFKFVDVVGNFKSPGSCQRMAYNCCLIRETWNPCMKPWLVFSTSRQQEWALNTSNQLFH